VGTSIAGRHAGEAATLYESMQPSATPVQVRDALQQAGNLSWSNTATIPTASGNGSSTWTPSKSFTSRRPRAAPSGCHRR